MARTGLPAWPKADDDTNSSTTRMRFILPPSS
jgi:hypothetical protein